MATTSAMLYLALAISDSFSSHMKLISRAVKQYGSRSAHFSAPKKVLETALARGISLDLK